MKIILKNYLFLNLRFRLAGLLLIISMSGTQKSFAQEKNIDSYIEGQLAVTTNGKAAFVNIGGASIKFISKKFNISLMMGPSLKFENENSKFTTVPVLGVGPQLYFLKNKRFILSFPFYYISSKKIWTMSAGIGYLLSKPK